MLERKTKRWLNSYSYFFGGLSEEEQQYRDYFETDLEQNPEIPEQILEHHDERQMAETEDFQHRKFDFVEESLTHESIESVEDIIDQKIFKFRY